MNIDDVAVGVIGSTFGLGPGALAAVGAARYYQKNMRKINPGFRAPKRPRGASGSVYDPAAIQNQPNALGVFKGPFRKRSIGVAENSVTQFGFHRETEHYGLVKCPNVQYLGVQSMNAVMAARGIAVAYLRMIFWRHYKQTYASEGDILFQVAHTFPFTASLDSIIYICGARDSNGVLSIDIYPSPSITGGITTVNDLVTHLQDKLESDDKFGLIDYTGAQVAQSMLVGYRLKFSDGSLSPVYYTDHQSISYTCATVVQLQNQTLTDNTAISSGISRVTNDANPVVGKVFTTSGLFPNVEQQYRSEWSDALRSNLDVPSVAGMIIPATEPVGAWRSIPIPQTFSNIIKCESGLRLEPGEIKTDFLKFRFRGTMRSLFEGLRVNAVATGASGRFVESDYHRVMGYNKLYAFEKVVPTGTDQVILAYHLDRYHACVMGFEYFQHSSRREYATTTFNRTIPAA